ncbi:MAG: DNA-processing protein DprA [Holophaga sp.]
MEPAHWALAFTLLSWPERWKAEIWACLQAGQEPPLPPEGRRDLERLARDLPRLRDDAARRGARLALPGEPEADRLLAPLPYPVALWVRGTLPPERPAVAMVGSRQGTRAALDRARAWARALTGAGVAVLSGLARGVDGAAHRGALDAGATWGIMGSGLDHPYPPEHAGLMDRIVASGGGVVTPFPPEARPLKWHFPRRNLILAAWTQGVALVAARYASGSLVTAKLALDLGKELWACPGAPEDPLAEGPNRLIRDGAARICLSAQDLLEDMRFLRWDLTNAP